MVSRIPPIAAAVLILASLGAPADAAIRINRGGGFLKSCFPTDADLRYDAESAGINASMCEEDIDILLQEAAVVHDSTMNGKKLCVPDATFGQGDKTVIPAAMVMDTLKANQARYAGDRNTPMITILREAIVQTFACR